MRSNLSHLVATILFGDQPCQKQVWVWDFITDLFTKLLLKFWILLRWRIALTSTCHPDDVHQSLTWRWLWSSSWLLCIFSSLSYFPGQQPCNFLPHTGENCLALTLVHLLFSSSLILPGVLLELRDTLRPSVGELGTRRKWGFFPKLGQTVLEKTWGLALRRKRGDYHRLQKKRSRRRRKKKTMSESKSLERWFCRMCSVKSRWLPIAWVAVWWEREKKKENNFVFSKNRSTDDLLTWNLDSVILWKDVFFFNYSSLLHISVAQQKWNL